MVETTTQHYGWVKPEIAHSPSTWGGFLNNDLDSIDALVFANQQGLVPIGGIQMFGGSTAPTNWLLCDGAAYSTTAPYDKLYAVLSTKFGSVDASHFNVPDLRSRMPMGAGTLGATGGEATHVLTGSELAAHAHPITDVVHGHSVNQWAHSHAIATGSHSHAITTGAHAHSGVLVSSGVTGATPPAGVGLVGNVGNTATVGNLGGNTDTAGNLGGNTDAQTSAISIVAGGTGLSATQNAGGGAAHNNLPPYVSLNFIIRYQ